MINRCPESRTRTNQSSRSCIPSGSNHTSISERIPVTGENGKVYRNAYCAKCHGVTNFRHWGLRVCCFDAIKNGSDVAYERLYLLENYTWELSPGNESAMSASVCTKANECETAVNTSESSQYTDLENKCRVYSQLVEADGVLYKNFHCATCNGKDILKFSKPPLHTKMYPLTVFFDYNSLIEGSRSGDKSSEVPYAQNNSDEAQNRTGEVKNEIVLGYFTWIGLSLSIICLLLVVITYIRFTKLQTVPGLILLALSLSLLAYQGLLLAVKL